MSDELIQEIVAVVRSGTARSRSEIATHCGLSVQKTATLLGRAVRAGKLRAAGRDARQSPIYELTTARPSALMAEVC
jgi:hypothetical protein